MLELFRDPAWQFAGVILALLSVAAAFWIYGHQQQTKELAFGVVSSRRVIAIADEVSSRVTIQVDGKAVKNLHLLIYGLKNSGHRAITPKDFERPLCLSFEVGQVVSAQISSQLPPNLYAKLIVSDTSVQLEPLLLNPGDHVLMQVLISASKPIASVDYRIMDVSSFVPINARPPVPRFHESGLFLLAITSVLIAVASYFFNSDKRAYQAFLGLAAFTTLFGYIGRLLDSAGSSARRRITEG